MAERCRIYLAGPEVFLEDAVAVGAAKKALCAERGFDGLFPFDNEIEGTVGVDMLIFRANVAMMRSAECGIFNLTPFRGPSADVGTVFELGLMFGMGKPCFGYTNVSAGLLDRMRADGLADDGSGRWRDADGMAIEHFGNADNLMIDAALREGGGAIVAKDASADARFTALSGFRECLGMVERMWSRRDGVRRPGRSDGVAA